MTDQSGRRDSDPELPEDLRELDRVLSSIRFVPRASLGPELLGRLRRGELPPDHSRRFRHAFRLAAVTLVIGTAVFLVSPTLVSFTRSRTVDQCCFDLDGGGAEDDGVLVQAGRNESVRRLTIYEDLDRSGGFTRGDLLRFDRGAAPVLHTPLEPSLAAFQHCCRDYDGGGKDDDGVLVLGVPPDRVMMAGIYDIRKAGDSRSPKGQVRPAFR